MDAKKAWLKLMSIEKAIVSTAKRYVQKQLRRLTVLPWWVWQAFTWMVTLRYRWSQLKLTLLRKTLDSLIGKCYCKESYHAEGNNNNEEAFALTMPSGENSWAAYIIYSTATIGKCSFRRFALVERCSTLRCPPTQRWPYRCCFSDWRWRRSCETEFLCTYPRSLMKPTVLSLQKLDEQFVKDELAQLNQCYRSRQWKPHMVDKPTLREIWFKSSVDWRSDCTSWKLISKKANWLLKANQKIWDKNHQVKWIASCLTTLKLTKLTHFLHKCTSWMTTRQLKLTNQWMLQ